MYEAGALSLFSGVRHNALKHEATRLFKVLVHVCFLSNTCLFVCYLFAFLSMCGIMSMSCVQLCRHWGALQFRL